MQDEHFDPEDLLSGYPDNLIINRPDLKTLLILAGEKILTVLFWAFWFYLWLPLISFIAWLLGFRILYQHMIELGGFDGFLRQLDVFTTGVALLSGSLALWSFYNMKRYSGYNRRNTVLLTDLGKLGATHSIPPQELERIQHAHKVCFSFDEGNGLSDIELNEHCRSR